MPQYLVASCLLWSRPFGWEGNWAAVLAAIACIALGIFSIRFSRSLSAKSIVRRADVPRWLYAILLWTGDTESTLVVAQSYTVLSGLGALAIGGLMVKLAFFSTC